MNIRRPILATLATLGVAAGIALTGPTAMAVPSTVPSNCTFNPSTGITTCVTSVAIPRTNMDSQAVYGLSLNPIRGDLASRACLALYPGSYAYTGAGLGVSTFIDAQRYSTTTTTYHGASTKSKPLTTAHGTSTVYTLRDDPDGGTALQCLYNNDPTNPQSFATGLIPTGTFTSNQ